MLAQISIKNTELPAFMSIIEHLRSGMVDSVTVLDSTEASFVVFGREMVRERLAIAEQRGAYSADKAFRDGLKARIESVPEHPEACRENAVF